MEKVKFKKVPFKLAGPVLLENKKLSFKAFDENGVSQHLDNYPGTKVLSVVPKLNTSICDLQTKKISDLATKYPKITFITVTRDEPKIIKKWLGEHEINNLKFLSDAKYNEFALLTNLYVPKLKILARALLALNEENQVIFNTVNEEEASEPDYMALDTFLKQKKNN